MVEYKVQVFEDRTAWYNLDGQFHREDGPALEYKDGYKAWFKNGNRHRLDGPAVEHPDGTNYWCIEDQKYTKQQFNAYIQKLN